MKEEQRLFIGIYPCGIVYADKFREKDNDYRRCCFLPYSTLEPEFERDCPAELRAGIMEDVKRMQSKRGQLFRTATTGDSYVMLGTKAEE